MKLRVASAIVLATLAIAPRAHADEARALQLFESGRALAKEGRCAEAIPIFLESAKEMPGVGAFLNLGSCSEQTGKRASARRYFQRAEEIAVANHDSRWAEAHERIVALEKALPRLTIRVAVDPASEPDLALRLDGDPLPRERWDIGEYVDPGVHIVEVTSSHRATTTLRAVVRNDGDTVEVVVGPPARAKDPVVRDRDPEKGGPLRTLGWALTGVGGVGIVTGGVFGALSVADHGTLVDKCPSYPTCDSSMRSELDELNDSARTKGNAATAMIIPGAILLVGGVVLLFTTR